MSLEYDTGWLALGNTDHKARLTVDGTILIKENFTHNLLAGYAGLFAYNNGGTAELYAIDGTGNTTLLSPHDPETQEWIFSSKNDSTGRVVRVDMERMVRYIDQLTGKDFNREWQEDPSKNPVENYGRKLDAAGKADKIEGSEIESIPRMQERIQLLEE